MIRRYWPWPENSKRFGKRCKYYKYVTFSYAISYLFDIFLELSTTIIEYIIGMKPNGVLIVLKYFVTEI